jgi:hypothetical protein
MNFLYFTRSNNDIDSMPNNATLDTDQKRKDFIGDQEAYNFSTQEGCMNPIWDGEKYITDINSIILSNKNLANELYNQIENHFLIVANNRTYNFDISKKIDFFAKFIMQADDDFLDWDDYLNETVQHNKQGSLAIIQSADAFLRSLFNAKKADKLAIENGDYSLSNLKAIQTQQDQLMV